MPRRHVTPRYNIEAAQRDLDALRSSLDEPRDRRPHDRKAEGKPNT